MAKHVRALDRPSYFEGCYPIESYEPRHATRGAAARRTPPEKPHDGYAVGNTDPERRGLYLGTLSRSADEAAEINR